MLKSIFNTNSINISKHWCLFMLLIIFSHYVFGIIINVPQDYNTIQGAINAVIDGTDERNEIIVSPQAQPYVESILIEGLTRSLTLRSTFDPDLGNFDAISNTILKAPSAHYNNSTGDLEFYPVVSIINCRGFDEENETPTNNRIIVQGFTITGGTGYQTISDTQNTTYISQGGGVYIFADDNESHAYQKVEVKHCEIYDNKACHGGGLYSGGSDIILSDSRIHNNELFYYGDLPICSHDNSYDGPKGGGVFLDGGFNMMNNVQVLKNKSYIDSGSNLYGLPYSQQLHTNGNYGAMYYRTFCHDSSANLLNCSFFENVTQVDPALVERCQWNVQANLFFQRGRANQDSLLFKSCTATRNRNITTTNLPHTALGIDRYIYDENNYNCTYYSNHIINCIVYDNTEGSNLNNQSTVSTKQIIGGHTPHQGTFTTIPVKIEYSDVNNADNTDFYDAIECIDADPLFCDSQSLDFRLKWSVETKSPCIDKGYPVLYDTVYDRPDMGSFEFDEFPHQTYLYTFPAASNRHGIKWLSFPVIYNVQNNQFSNNILAGDLFNEDNILHSEILDYFEWNDINTPENDMLEIASIQEGWSNLTHMITSLQGYKVQMSPNNNQQQVIDISGFLQDYNNPPILLYNRDPITDEITENWIGYYFNRIQHVFDAFGENINNIYYIKTQYWAMMRDLSNQEMPWITYSSDARDRELILKPGDLVIVKCFQDLEFTWDINGPERPPYTPPRPEHYEFVEKIDYIPIYTDFRGGDIPLPKEIAVYINGVCKGATVVTDSLAQICAYICDDLPDNSEVEFMLYYDSKNQGVIPSYEVWNQAQGRFVKEKLVAQGKPDYYLVSFTKTALEDTPLPRIQLSNYPNPFNPQTTIRYYVPKDSKVQVSIYNAKGQLVKTLVNEKKNAGMQETIWQGDDKNGTPCASGVYYCKLQYKNKNISKKLILMK